MSLIAAPTLGLASIEWSLDRPAQINADVSGKRTVGTPLYGIWRARADFAPIVGEDGARLIRSFLFRCHGPVNTFQINATESAQNANSGVTLSASASAGDTSVTLSGVTTSLTDGQMVTLAGQLLQLTADQSGSTITFEPPLRADAASGTAAETSRPYATVRLAGTGIGWSIDPGRVYGFSIDVEEAI